MGATNVGKTAFTKDPDDDPSFNSQSVVPNMSSNGHVTRHLHVLSLPDADVGLEPQSSAAVEFYGLRSDDDGELGIANEIQVKVRD